MVIHRCLSRKWRLLLITFGVIVFAGIVAFQKGRLFIKEMGTAKRLTQIMMALENYCQVNHCYPPQYLADMHGKPAHSWRVLVLPYLGKEDVYRRYRFDEPWNGPHNRFLAAEMPGEYRSPFTNDTSTITQYVGIAGAETPWRGTIPLKLGELKRPSDAVVWFVEAANSDIHWMEPRDIPFEQASEGINAPDGGGIQSNYSHGLPAEMLFGQKRIPLDISPEVFRAMLTITGGKEIAGTPKRRGGTKEDKGNEIDNH